MTRNQPQEMTVAHGILSELQVVMGRALLDYMRGKNIRVIKYDRYNAIMDGEERAEDYTPYGFILTDEAGLSFVFYNDKQPYPVKVHTLLHHIETQKLRRTAVQAQAH